jgi:hypothetical protein
MWKAGGTHSVRMWQVKAGISMSILDVERKKTAYMHQDEEVPTIQ